MKDWQDYLGSFKWLNAFRGFRKSLWSCFFKNWPRALSLLFSFSALF
jgi:hypothetical protein